MSRVVMPLAYKLMIMSSKSLSRRVPFGTVTGSNVPLRSRGTATSTGPAVVCTVLPVSPLREFPDPLPSAACLS